VHRHFFLLVPASGREDEAARALSDWLARVQDLPGFRGGAVLREYAGEFGGLPNVLALTYDLEPELRHAFWDTTSTLPDPMRPDLPGPIPPDQTAALLTDAGHTHTADHDDAHTHAGDHVHDIGEHLEFNRGGGLFARVLHVHSEILVDTTRPADYAALERV